LNSTNKIDGTTTSESGLDDIVVRGGRALIPQSDSGFSFDGALAVKMPKANNNKGIGTDEANKVTS
jgi:hypothetical protein